MLVKQSSSFSWKYQTLSLQICVHQTVQLTTKFLDWCRNVFTLYKHLSTTSAAVTSDLNQRLIDTWASIEKNLSMKQLVDYVQPWRRRTSLWTSAKRKPAPFRADTLCNRQPALIRANTLCNRQPALIRADTLCNRQPALFRADTLCNRQPALIRANTLCNRQPALIRANTLCNRLFQSRQQSTEENTLFRIISIAAIYKQIKYVKLKVQGKLNMHIIFESVLMLLTENYQN